MILGLPCGKRVLEKGEISGTLLSLAFPMAHHSEVPNISPLFVFSVQSMFENVAMPDSFS